MPIRCTQLFDLVYEHFVDTVRGFCRRQYMAKRKRQAAKGRFTRKKQTAAKRRPAPKRRSAQKRRTVAKHRTGAKRRPATKRRAPAKPRTAAKRRTTQVAVACDKQSPEEFNGHPVGDENTP